MVYVAGMCTSAEVDLLEVRKLALEIFSAAFGVWLQIKRKGEGL